MQLLFRRKHNEYGNISQLCLLPTTSIEYKNAGIILKYTPRVNAQVYQRSADTEVRYSAWRADIGKEEVKAMSRVPFLSDLPFFGGLVKNVNNSKNENEVIVFLTARIVK